MKIARLQIKQAVVWRIEKDTPPILTAQLGGLSLVNPLLLAQTTKSNGAPSVTFPDASQAVFSLPEIGLVTDRTDLLMKADMHVTAFLACLEDVSEQNGLSSMSSLSASVHEDIEIPSTLHFPDVTTFPNTASFKKSYIDT